MKVADGVLSKYDDGGNLTGTYYAATGAQLSSSTYGTANRLQNDGVYTYTYDDAGQMTGKSKSGESWTYGYDSNGQMVSAGNGTDAVAYTFDAFGNRLSRVQSGGTSKTERFAYDGADAFLDLDGSNAVTVHRQYGPGVDNLLSRQAGGSVEWYGTDMQGSVRQVFDNAGKQTSWADYEAHGALVGGGTLTDRYGFTGRELDGLTGQQYNRARVLDGQSWTSEDPMGFAAGDANLRRYVGNAPTNGTDPSGLAERLTSDDRNTLLSIITNRSAAAAALSSARMAFETFKRNHRGLIPVNSAAEDEYSKLLEQVVAAEDSLKLLDESISLIPDKVLRDISNTASEADQATIKQEFSRRNQQQLRELTSPDAARERDRRAAEDLQVVLKERADAERRPLEMLFTFSTALVPIVGQLVAASEAITGEDLFGKKLSNTDRIILGTAAALPVLGRAVSKLLPFLRTTTKGTVIAADLVPTKNLGRCPVHRSSHSRCQSHLPMS